MRWGSSPHFTREKTEVKGVTEFAGSHRAVKLKKKKKRKKEKQGFHTGLFDSKVYRLNHEAVLLPAMLVGRGGIQREGESFVLLSACYVTLSGSV